MSFEILLITIFTALGFWPLLLIDVTSPQIIILLVTGASLTTFLIISFQALSQRLSVTRIGNSTLMEMIPRQITHNAIILQSKEGFIGLGFISLSENWIQKYCNQLIELLYNLTLPISFVFARDVAGTPKEYLLIRHVDSSPQAVEKTITSLCQKLHTILIQNKVPAELISDQLSLEQLFWLSVLGKPLGEMVQLDCEENLVSIKIGNQEPRLIVVSDFFSDAVTFNQQTSTFLNPAIFFDTNVPFFLTLSLQPIPLEEVVNRLRQIAFKVPEVGMLIDTLGEKIVKEALTMIPSSIGSEVITLLQGQQEGLWKWEYRIVTSFSKPPWLTIDWHNIPRLLGCSGLSAVAQGQFLNPMEVTTSQLLTLLQKPSLKAKHSKTQESKDKHSKKEE